MTIRGIERFNIVSDSEDRHDFVRRLGTSRRAAAPRLRSRAKCEYLFRGLKFHEPDFVQLVDNVSWFADLNAQAAAKVRKALAQLEADNMSEVKPVGGGVSERRIHWGKGLRVYFAQDGQTIIILLGGGSKATQNRDIERALEYWTDYKQRRNRERK